jgi:hypothetical protein
MHTHPVAEEIMLAWETSVEPLEMRRRFDEDEDEFEDGFTFDDEEEDDLDEEEDDFEGDDDEDEDLDDELILDEEEEE